MRPLALAGSVLLCIACAHTREDEMTAAEHRNEAALHRARADAQRAKYDPHDLRAAPRPLSDAEAEWTQRVYNPTQQHLVAADRELRAAAEHLRAARTLEAFEDARCAAIPAAERAACPLLASSVKRVTETRGGVLLELHAHVDAVATHRQLDCHLAYATAQGFDRPSCPLFVKGMSLSLVLEDGKRLIGMSSDDPKLAEQIRAQARRIFWAPENVSGVYP